MVHGDLRGQGWQRLEAVVAPSKLVALEASFDALLGYATAPQVWQLPNGARAMPDLLSHFNPELTARLATILGAERLRVLQDVLIQKPPGAPEVAWHTDHTYTGFLVPARAMSVRLSLVDSDVSSGCLAVLDGSHGWDVPDSFLSGEVLIEGGALAQLPEQLSRQAAEAVVDLPLRAGDISLHHCRTWHMSHPNRSEHTRKTIVVHVFDADCTVDEARVPERVRGHIRLDELPLLPIRP